MSLRGCNTKAFIWARFSKKLVLCIVFVHAGFVKCFCWSTAQSQRALAERILRELAKTPAAGLPTEWPSSPSNDNHNPAIRSEMGPDGGAVAGDDVASIDSRGGCCDGAEGLQQLVLGELAAAGAGRAVAASDRAETAGAGRAGAAPGEAPADSFGSRAARSECTSGPGSGLFHKTGSYGGSESVETH